ncbi:unnamed protein product [Closterium sp. Naga37s-1]|nr:unnamed protein product [Closterium sp. Naga37s-1]
MNIESLKVQEAPYEQAAVAVGTMIRQLAVAAVSLLPPNQQAAVLQAEPLLQPAPGALESSNPQASTANGIPSHANEEIPNPPPAVLSPTAAHPSAAPEAATWISPELRTSSTVAEPGEPRREPAGEARAEAALDATPMRDPTLDAQSLIAVGRKRGRNDECETEPVTKAVCYAEPRQRSNLCGALRSPGLGVAVAAEPDPHSGMEIAGDMETGGYEEKLAQEVTGPTGASSCGLPTAGAVSEIFSCPVAGCPFHKQHPGFRAFKSKASLRNHYRRTHAGEALLCSRCGSKSFCLPADLEAHERRCGPRRWLCSCGNSFSRKDKLANHLKRSVKNLVRSTQPLLQGIHLSLAQAPPII